VVLSVAVVAVGFPEPAWRPVLRSATHKRELLCGREGGEASRIGRLDPMNCYSFHALNLPFGASSFQNRLVDLTDSAYPVDSLRVRELHDFGVPPVEVVRDERYFAPYLIQWIDPSHPGAARDPE
jgi:hypothetical protein